MHALIGLLVRILIGFVLSLLHLPPKEGPSALLCSVSQKSRASDSWDPCSRQLCSAHGSLDWKLS